MAYLGRQASKTALTSADIPDDSITAAKIVDGAVTSDLVYLENKATTQNLSGTYSTERMYLNDSYTLTGNVTVTGHLALGTIADEDVVITQDSTERTITGSGTLDSGNVLQDTHRTSLTDMTGELGSAITGSPNLNLSNVTIFPAGHVVNFHSQVRSSGVTTYNHDIVTAWSKIDLNGDFDITGVSATEGNLLIFSFGGPMWNANDDGTYATEIAISTDGTSLSEVLAHSMFYGGTDIIQAFLPFNFSWIYTVPAGFSSETVSVITKSQTGGTAAGAWRWTLGNMPNAPQSPSTAYFSIQEIQT